MVDGRTTPFATTRDFSQYSNHAPAVNSSNGASGEGRFASNQRDRCSLRSFSIRSAISGASSPSAKSRTQWRTRLRSICGCMSSSATISVMSLGRMASDFMTIKSSGVARRISTPSTGVGRPRAIISSSNGIAPSEMSIPSLVRSCCKRSTRLLRANSSASGRRGGNPFDAASAIKDGQSFSAIMMTASMSCVALGRPWSEAATPPTTTCEIRFRSSHWTSACRGGISGRRDSSIDTHHLFQSNPSLANETKFLFSGCVPTKANSHSHHGGKLANFGLNGCSPKFLPLEIVHELPPIHPRPKLGLCVFRLHISIIATQVAFGD